MDHLPLPPNPALPPLQVRFVCTEDCDNGAFLTYLRLPYGSKMCVPQIGSLQHETVLLPNYAI